MRKIAKRELRKIIEDVSLTSSGSNLAELHRRYGSEFTYSTFVKYWKIYADNKPVDVNVGERK